jgi:uncharacterized protein YjbJ (UPF0337 family)
MKFNENSIKGKWLEVKGEIQKNWEKLTDDELERTKGDLKTIKGLVQQRYGRTQDNYENKIDEIFQKFGNQKDRAVVSVKEIIK